MCHTYVCVSFYDALILTIIIYVCFTTGQCNFSFFYLVKRISIFDFFFFIKVFARSRIKKLIAVFLVGFLFFFSLFLLSFYRWHTSYSAVDYFVRDSASLAGKLLVFEKYTKIFATQHTLCRKVRFKRLLSFNYVLY